MSLTTKSSYIYMCLFLFILLRINECFSVSPCLYPPSNEDCGEVATDRYFYSNFYKKCLLFTFRGCPSLFGARNNFKTLQECKDTCIPDPTVTSSTPSPTVATTEMSPTTELPADICHHPLNIGIPGIPIIRELYYYYNSTANECDWFYYYGSGGNDNKFEDISSCQERCVTTYSTQPTSTTGSSVILDKSLYPCEGSECGSGSGTDGSGERSVLSYITSTTTHLILITHSSTHSTQSETMSTIPSSVISSSSSSTVAITTSTPSSSTTQPSNPDEDKLPTSSSSDDPSIFYYGTIVVICVIVVVFGVATLIISAMCWRRHKNLQERDSTVKTSWTTNRTPQTHPSPSTSSTSNSSSDTMI